MFCSSSLPVTFRSLLLLPSNQRACIYKQLLASTSRHPRTMASSAHKLIPSDPEKVMVIRKVHPDVMTCSVPFLRFGRVKVGGRGTIVKLTSGNLAVFSPVALTDTVKKELASFGTGDVRYIAALDQEHHIFLESWHKAFPEAKVLGPETLPEYRDKQKYFKIPDNNWLLFRKANKESFSVSEEFDADFNFEYVHSHANHELVFCHKPSKTLIEADLMFNLPANEQFSKTGVSPTTGVISKILNALQNTQGDATAQKRLIWYGTSSGDRPGFNQSIGKIVKWDFERIVPCHGDVIESDAKGIFEKVFQWHLQGLNSGA